MNTIEKDLSSKLSESVKFDTREHVELLSIIESWHSDTIDQQRKRMKRLLSKAKPVPTKSGARGSYKSDEILSHLPQGMQVKSILDLGAGDGDIVTSLAKKLKLDSKQVWALTVTKLPPSDFYSRITYEEDRSIPLPDASIDLVVIAQVLHHIHPEDRKTTLLEVKRILSPSGVVVVQEHDFRDDLETYIALDILHTFWYVKKNEQVDGLYLMSRDQLTSLFSKIGMRREKATDAKRWQWIYWASFAFGETEEEMSLQKYLVSPEYAGVIDARSDIPTSLQPFDSNSLYLASWNKQLAYHHRYASELGTNNIYWGQLKLFLSILQALVQLWDHILVPNLTVVYAGASPGWSFGVLQPMFPTITWHLYDPKSIDVKTIPNKLMFHKQYFTEATAQQWSQDDNVFFFSDIRRFGSDKLQGKELEKKIMEDMAMQARWTMIMNPYRASLKLRAPYLIEELSSEERSYLDGNVMLQSFNSPTSAEARLIPIRYKATGKYYSKEWDWKRYEDMLFYHNAVIREQALYSYDGEPGGVVNDASGLDNHFESIHLLTILDEYRKKFGTHSMNSIQLAVKIMRELSSYSKKGDITLARIRREGEQAD